MLTEARTKWERMQRSGIDTINQVPHLTVDSVWESDKTHKKHIKYQNAKRTSRKK